MKQQRFFPTFPTMFRTVPIRTSFDPFRNVPNANRTEPFRTGPNRAGLGLAGISIASNSDGSGSLAPESGAVFSVSRLCVSICYAKNSIV